MDVIIWKFTYRHVNEHIEVFIDNDNSVEYFFHVSMIQSLSYFDLSIFFLSHSEYKHTYLSMGVK